MVSFFGDISNKFDHDRTYYRFIWSHGVHQGLFYEENKLVIDHNEFNDTELTSNVKGGIYFTDQSSILTYGMHGDLILPITVPADARVVRLTNKNEWRADRVMTMKSISVYDFCNDVLQWDFSNQKDVNLPQLDRLPKDKKICFDNDGLVSLPKIKEIPENVTFDNKGDVFMKSLVSFDPLRLTFQNSGNVYLR